MGRSRTRNRSTWSADPHARARTFVQKTFYVLDYDLERSDGLLQRHLNSVYKVLSQTVPDGVKTDEPVIRLLRLGSLA